MLEKINRGCNLILATLVTDSRAHLHGALSLQALHTDPPPFIPFMVRSADSRMTRLRPFRR